MVKQGLLARRRPPKMYTAAFPAIYLMKAWTFEYTLLKIKYCPDLFINNILGLEQKH